MVTDEPRLRMARIPRLFAPVSTAASAIRELSFLVLGITDQQLLRLWPVDADRVARGDGPREPQPRCGSVPRMRTSSHGHAGISFGDDTSGGQRSRGSWKARR